MSGVPPRTIGARSEFPFASKNATVPGFVGSSSFSPSSTTTAVDATATTPFETSTLFGEPKDETSSTPTLVGLDGIGEVEDVDDVVEAVDDERALARRVERGNLGRALVEDVGDRACSDRPDLRERDGLAPRLSRLEPEHERSRDEHDHDHATNERLLHRRLPSIAPGTAAILGRCTSAQRIPSGREVEKKLHVLGEPIASPRSDRMSTTRRRARVGAFRA